MPDTACEVLRLRIVRQFVTVQYLGSLIVTAVLFLIIVYAESTSRCKSVSSVFSLLA